MKKEKLENNADHSTTFYEKISNMTGWFLLVSGLLIGINTLIEKDLDKWFSSLSISLICFGFAGIIFKLRSIKINKHD